MTEVVHNSSDPRDIKVWEYPTLDLLDDPPATKKGSKLSFPQVSLKQALTSNKLQENKSVTAFSIGTDQSGKPFIVDFSEMFHLLITGVQGSGKSELLRTIISTFLFRTTPNEIKLILADLKAVDLSEFNGVPSLLTPVVTEEFKVLSALKWSVAEMDRRYKLLQEFGSRSIGGYNEASGFQAWPYIIFVIDEVTLALEYIEDDVMEATKMLTERGARVGIHMILTTNNPDSLPKGLEEGFPARVSFRLITLKDSVRVLGEGGAEKLTTFGNLIYRSPHGVTEELHATLVSNNEAKRTVEFLKNQGAMEEN